MRILLVRVDNDVLGNMKNVGGRHQPLGLLYVASMLEAHGFEVKVVDEMVGDIYEDAITEFKPDVVGLGVVSPCIKRSIYLSNFAHEHGAKVIAGGPHASAIPVRTIIELDCEAACFGESEWTFLEYCQGKPLNEIDGLAYRDDKGAIHKNNPRALEENLDKFPFPARHLIDLKKYAGTVQFGFVCKPGEITTQINSSRGCPFTCTFCADHTTFQRRTRYRSPENIVAEIKMLKEKYGIRSIIFDDVNFTTEEQRVRDICAAIKDLKIRWSCQLRVKISEETLKAMKDSGCEVVSFGVESGSQKVLNKVQKGITIGMIEDTFSIARKVGLKTKSYFIVGLPGEEWEDLEQSVALAKRINPDYLWLSFFTPVPGAKLFDEYTDEYKEGNWEGLLYFYNKNPDLNKKYKYFLKSFYIRPEYFMGFLRRFSVYEAKYLYDMGKTFLLKGGF